MKIVFLIQTHKDPEHILRLVDVLRKGVPDCFILISHDRAAAPLPEWNEENLAVVRGQGGRGDFAIIDGYLAAIRWLRQSGLHYDWLINLSGADYPSYPLHALQADLDAADHDGFLLYFDAFAPPKTVEEGESGRDRYGFQYRLLKNKLSPVQRKLIALPRIILRSFNMPWRIFTAYGLMVGTRASDSPFDGDFRCYRGSYWHAIRARCVDYIIDAVEEHPDLVAYFRHVLIPDESFFQTVLVNNPAFRFVSDNRRYFDMSGSRHGHPRKLGESDLPRLLSGDWFFARKLEREAGPAMFDALDDHALSGR